jgi:hypothetical protein
VLQPFHETLYTYYHLQEHQRFDVLMRDAEGLQSAKRTAIAFHQPKDLEDERRDLLSRFGGQPSHDDALERGLKMLKDLQEIDARREAAINAPVETSAAAAPPEVPPSGD